MNYDGVEFELEQTSGPTFQTIIKLTVGSYTVKRSENGLFNGPIALKTPADEFMLACHYRFFEQHYDELMSQYNQAELAAAQCKQVQTGLDARASERASSSTQP